mmetsp:Transcript_115139/g.229327  ORF Transcript_115139/g.229327 Transcript_115139/m.229327 type:complete len:106 (+) Transcript_115139:1111-1428(+)
MICLPTCILPPASKEHVHHRADLVVQLLRLLQMKGYRKFLVRSSSTSMTSYTSLMRSTAFMEVSLKSRSSRLQASPHQPTPLQQRLSLFYLGRERDCTGDEGLHS